MTALRLSFRKARFAVLVVALALAAGTARAQTAPPPTPPAAGTAAPQRGAFIAKFQAANVTHDGHLTLAQAQQGQMRGIVRNFAAIDQSHKGFVTLADIRAYRQAARAAKGQQP